MKANDILLAHDCYINSYWFMQVIKATDKSVTIRQIESNKRTGMPIVGEFTDDAPMTKRVKGDRISLGTWRGAELWDGNAVHNEHPMWGLNYNLY